MVPVFEQTTSGPIGYGYPEFRERFVSICAEHLAEGRALAFAFLLFDEDTPEIAKVLRDPEYWRALDEVAGRYLSVFTLVGTQPGPKLQTLFSNYFGTEGIASLPAILLFQVDSNKVSQYCFVQLQGEGIEPAFNEIRALLRDVVDALAKSGPEGHMNAGQAFDAVKSRLRKRTGVRYVRQGVAMVKSIVELLGLARGMIGG
jgi:hypothetical protein